MLAREKLMVSRQTLWRWLSAEHLIVRERRCRQHRRRRQRRACVGELIQMDGSTHAWLGPDHPDCVLFVMVDDASGQVFARFYATEDTSAACDLFRRYAKRYGLPAALYVDHDSIYVVNDPEAHEKARQAGRKPPQTQFGRAMEELGVLIIAADSPQAKGRVERMNRTLQDRLLHELALVLEEKGLHDLATANGFLEQHFLSRFNARFSRTPANGVNVHRAVPRGVKLEEVLCAKETRVVGQDWCVRFANRILQIAPRHESLKLAGQPVAVWQLPAGPLQLRHRGQKLSFTELAQRPAQAPAPQRPFAATSWRPSPEHPWRRGPTTRAPAARAASAAPPAKNFGGVVKPVPLQANSLRSPAFRSTALTTPHQGVTLLLQR
jgi:hypothetical protein